MKLKKIPESFKDSDNVIERLVYVVDEQMGEDFLTYAEDICNHGISGGFSGFIYYSDTCAFYQANKDDIWELAYDQHEELGCRNIIEMIAGFGVADSVGGAEQFENLMAWYAAEEAARYVVDYEPPVKTRKKKAK